MRNKRIDVKIRKAISFLTGVVGISQNLSARRALASSLRSANKPLGNPPPHFTYNKLNSILHKTVSVGMALLDASRPRGLCLTRRVTSLAIFVSVLLVLTGLFTIEGVGQTTPGKSTNLTAIPGDGQLAYSWDAPSETGGGITRYEYRSQAQGVPLTAITSTGSTGTTFTLTGLTNGKGYTFHLRAVSNNGNGGTTSVIATPNITAPTGLTATSNEDGQVPLSWTAPTGYTTITYYQYNDGSTR